MPGGPAGTRDFSLSRSDLRLRQHVADTAHRMDAAGKAVAVELLAQAVQQHLQRVGTDLVVKTVDAFLEMILRHHLAGATRSEEHTSELQSLLRNSYAVFC